MAVQKSDSRARIAELISELSKNLTEFSEILLNATETIQNASNQTSATNGGEKKKKVEKDPNAPKRNLSSYMLYSQAVRPNMVEKHPDLKAVEIAKLIGEQWNALSDKEKQPYIKQAEKEKVRFVKETKSYQASLVANNSDASSSDETSTEKRKAEQTTEKKDKKKAKKSSSDEKKSSSDDKKKSSHKKK